MSNALLVAGERTTTGRPLAVMGPQVGYFSPQGLVEKDVHGPGIDARGVAFPGTDASRRSTYRAELTSALGFRRLNDPDQMRGGFPSFRQAVAGIDYTFNWFYVDERDIGYQHSCRCPQRARGVDPNLPSWGTGREDWAGFIPRSANPWDLNPASGYLSSWNNRQAPGFTAADHQFSAGPVYRSQLLDRRIGAALRPARWTAPRWCRPCRTPAPSTCAARPISP